MEARQRGVARGPHVGASGFQLELRLGAETFERRFPLRGQTKARRFALPLLRLETCELGVTRSAGCFDLRLGAHFHPRQFRGALGAYASARRGDLDVRVRLDPRPIRTPLGAHVAARSGDLRDRLDPRPLGVSTLANHRPLNLEARRLIVAASGGNVQRLRRHDPGLRHAELRQLHKIWVAIDRGAQGRAQSRRQRRVSDPGAPELGAGELDVAGAMRQLCGDRVAAERSLEPIVVGRGGGDIRAGLRQGERRRAARFPGTGGLDRSRIAQREPRPCQRPARSVVIADAQRFDRPHALRHRRPSGLGAVAMANLGQRHVRRELRADLALRPGDRQRLAVVAQRARRIAEAAASRAGQAQRERPYQRRPR